MIGWVRNLIIGDCGRRVDNLVPKNRGNSAEFFY